MTRLKGCVRWMALLSAGGTLLATGGCLPPNFYSTLLADTVVTGVAGAVLNAVLANAGL